MLAMGSSTTVIADEIFISFAQPTSHNEQSSSYSHQCYGSDCFDKNCGGVTAGKNVLAIHRSIRLRFKVESGE
jgi:hypothetical protein